MICKNLAPVRGLILVAALCWAAGAGAAMPAPLPLYVQECGACHVAYAPGMLPAASWRRLVSGLARHFGVDASLDEASAQSIDQWLQSNAGGFRHAHEAPPQDRITLSDWYVRQHDEVSAAVWQRKSVGSAANCQACHPGAANWRFSEHEVRIPR